jgi:hypothetical protein
MFLLGIASKALYDYVQERRLGKTAVAMRSVPPSLLNSQVLD